MPAKSKEFAQIIFENKAGTALHQYNVPVAIPTWHTWWVENTMRRGASQFLSRTRDDVLVVFERMGVREPFLLLEEFDGKPLPQVDPRNELEQVGLGRFLEPQVVNSVTRRVSFRPSLTEMLRANKTQFLKLFTGS